MINNLDTKIKTIQAVTLEKKSEENYRDFLKEYYTAQSNWLTMWITFLAIILGAVGIAAPIMLADKKKEMNDILEKGEKTLDHVLKVEKNIDSKLTMFDKEPKRGKEDLEFDRI